MKSASLPTGTSQLEIKVTLRHRRQVNDTFSLTFDVADTSTAKERYLRWIKLTFDVADTSTAKERYLRWIKLVGDRHTTGIKDKIEDDE